MSDVLNSNHSDAVLGEQPSGYPSLLVARWRTVHKIGFGSADITGSLERYFCSQLERRSYVDAVTDELFPLAPCRRPRYRETCVAFGADVHDRVSVRALKRQDPAMRLARGAAQGCAPVVSARDPKQTSRHEDRDFGFRHVHLHVHNIAHQGKPRNNSHLHGDTVRHA